MPSKYTLDSKEVDFQNPVYKRNAEAKTEANGQYDKYEANKVKLDDGNGSTSSSTSSKDEKDEGRKTKLPTVGFAEMFKYSTPGERFLMFLGTLSACANGASTPIMIIVFGNMADTLFISNDYANHLATYVPQWFAKCLNMTSIGPDACQNVTVNYILGDPSPPDRLQSTCEMLMYPAGCDVINDTALWNPESTLEDDMTGFSIIYIILACCVFVVAYLQVICWQITSYNQTQRIRTKLFRSILRQEIGWFDTHEAGELNSRLADDVDKIENGIGDQLGLFVQYISAFLAGIIIAFVYSWKLTLVVLSVSPLLALASMVIGKLGASMTARELKAYAKAGAVAEEVLVAIRTVVSFGGEAKECERYNKNLVAARNYGVRKGSVTGLALGALFLVMFGSYGLGFWYGSKMVFNFEISAGDMLTVFFCVLSGTFSLGSAAPNIQEFAGARGAAYVIYQIIENEPKIDSFSKDGKKDVKLSGNIEFQNVHFNYPSRPEVNVLQGLSMKISIGQTVALVGSSGCGKSTTVQLLQRFYDPHEGQVTLDGTDVRDYNVKWLRRQIGVVSQEPVLFATSIAENIRYGNEDVKMDDIIRACKEANAHDFVIKLPNKYDTLVGERGAQLSGGQKQRIAIARALVRNPKVLLLDEATSALDTESEASVQAALDKARQGRTTLVIAHRLSTIRTADVIVGVRDGQVVEQGTHDELMARNGLYYELVMNQQTRSADANEDDISLEEDIPMKPGFEHSVSVVSQGKRIRTFSALSGGSMMDKQSMKEEETEVLPEVGLKRIMRANAPEWPFLILGSFAALIAGGVQPAVAVVMSEFIGIFSDGGPDVMDKVNLYAGMFVVIGVGAGLATMLQNVSFSRSGENLTMRLRQLSFQSLMKQDMSYFDDHSNNVGALCTRLATDASAVQGATGSRLGMFCQAMSGLGAGLIIGLVFSWELTLLIVGFMPFLLLSGFIRMRVVSGNMAGRKIALEKAGKIAVEVIENIRTVATLTKEQKFLDDYEHETLKPFKDNKKKVYVHGGAFAFSSCVMFFAQAASFRLGAFLIVNRGLPIKNMFRVFSAVAFGAMSAGRAGSFAPDYGKAKASAAKVFALLDRVPSIDVTDKGGKKPSNCQGTIQLRDVHFNYPTRPNIAVLTGLDLNVRPGQTVALVGSSGCGKSTTVQLLERFYDPLQGDVSIEGESIHDLNLSWVRSQMGIVSQEPILFDCSIRDNIAYGDNSRNVSMAEIIEAAKNANIHSFIENLPQGYDTNVGDKGAQLSGGQKQRVAIARALVRNPKILLLDEATSALDTESEKVVQAALDRAQEGRTCIVIAHRLSTIQNADVIVVIHHGKVVEKGTHEELLQKKGRYYSLNNAQLKKDT